jgi:Fe-S-cluster containining protein
VTRQLRNWGAESRAAFADARDPAALSTAVVTFYRRVDEVIDASVSGHNVAVACTRGCSYCCHLRLAVQPHEAFALAGWLRRNFDAQRLAGVIERVRANARATDAMGVEARKRTNMACALLDEDGSCTAYEARPAQCRRYHSTRVETCRSFYETPADETIESPLHPVVAHNAAVLITQAQHAVRAAGLDAENEDMNYALLDALENPKAWRRWRDGKQPFVRTGAPPGPREPALR